jgi:hypothetical protein
MVYRLLGWLLALLLLAGIRAVHVYLWTHLRDSWLKRLLLRNLWHGLRREGARRQRIRRLP